MNDYSLPHRRPQSVQVVGVASGAGARDTGCEAGADALRAMRITARLRAHGFSAHWADVIRPAAAYRADTLKAVRKICMRLAKRVERIIAEGDLPVVVGGDHTCAIGTWKGVAHALEAQGRVGLLWIDAHMDAHTPQTTESGMLHGMPVACLLGYGYPELTAIAHGAKLDPKCVCLYGVRSFERGEAEFLERLGVRVFFMEEISRRGVRRTLAEALAMVSCASGGFGITLDLDAIDPEDAPGVGSPAPDGMAGAELMSALAGHGGHPNLVGVEIVEYNPYRDRQAATAGLVGDALDAILAGQAALAVDTVDGVDGVDGNLAVEDAPSQGMQLAEGKWKEQPENRLMLVRFDSKSGTITTFGDVAIRLLRMMGQSGTVPGAILAQDIPAAVQKLRQAMGRQQDPAAPREGADEDEPRVNLSQRAFPLIELLERAAKSGADVIWEEESKAI